MASDKYKGPINQPCSACGAGDTAMEYHDHDYVRGVCGETEKLAMELAELLAPEAYEVVFLKLRDFRRAAEASASKPGPCGREGHLMLHWTEAPKPVYPQELTDKLANAGLSITTFKTGECQLCAAEASAFQQGQATGCHPAACRDELMWRTEIKRAEASAVAGVANNAQEIATALKNMLEACYQADAREDLPHEVDGETLIDAARKALLEYRPDADYAAKIRAKALEEAATHQPMIATANNLYDTGNSVWVYCSCGFNRDGKLLDPEEWGKHLSALNGQSAGHK